MLFINALFVKNEQLNKTKNVGCHRINTDSFLYGCIQKALSYFIKFLNCTINK